ncbi:MAG: PD-(D/E)XK nuclease family protein, partial [Nocardioidaceae bacterium]
PAQFPTAAGERAPTLALRSTRRFGPAILDASRAVISRAGVTGHLDPQTFEAFRRPRPVDPPYGDGEVLVQTYSSPAAEAENIALQLRRAHLSEGLPWSEMAVLVRSGTASIPRLQRALVAAGVPVEVAGDELPLRSSPAVAPLLDALRLVEGLARDGRISADRAHALLTGPIGAVDESSVRVLARALRRLDARIDPETERATRLARPSDELLAEALAEPALLAQVEHGRTSRVAGRVARLARLVADARRQLEERAAPEQILWGLWHGSGWARRLREAVDRGGEAARSADRDLDAVCALFDLAARAEERQQRRGLSPFIAEIEAQQIPADTLADRGVRGEAVRVLTAHRSKGLEWRLVVVAGVQEGVWPDLRRRGTLLQADLLDHDGPQPPAGVAATLAEERRLFYVAVTRARQRLVVTAVESPSDDGDQPSRFLLELREHVAERGARAQVRLGRPARPLSLRGAVGELRAIAETTTNEGIRRAAVTRLARLAGAGGGTGDRAADKAIDGTADGTGGWAGVGCANPDRWWGVRERTVNAVPIRPPDRPLELSGSSLDKIVTCPLSWFLSHEAKGDTASTTAQGFGLLLHALAADVVHGNSPDDPAKLLAHLDDVWERLSFSAPWVSARERAEAEQAIGRFVAWHREHGDREPLAAEHRFEVTVPIGAEEVVLRGSMDRVEVDAGGRVHVVDLKTGRNQVPGERLRNHAQLGLYQLAVEHGAVHDLAPGARSGGAELVHLRIDASSKTPGVPKVQPQDPPVEGETFVAVEQLLRATRALREEDFAATPSPEACSYCAFRSLCPAQPEGRTILPSTDGAEDTPRTEGDA